MMPAIAGKSDLRMRFRSAFIWLGLPIIALLLLPACAVAVRGSAVWLIETRDSVGEFYFKSLSYALLGLAASQILGVYIWHFSHHRGMLSDLKIKWMPESGLASLGTFIALTLSYSHNGSDLWKMALSALILGEATFFSSLYIRHRAMPPQSIDHNLQD